MGRQINFHIVQTTDSNIQFTADDITITIDGFTFDNGKHHIRNPQIASAHFKCCEKVYKALNTSAVPTVEDWYSEELLPKFQMLSILMGVDNTSGHDTF